MRWDEMSMSQKSEAIGLMVRNGVTDIGTMKQMWDDMDGRKKQKPSYAEWVKSVNPQFVGPDYNLKAAYDELPFETMEAWRKDPNANHLPDTYKLPSHPTFSLDSKDPLTGMKGGAWLGDRFYPSQTNRLFNPDMYPHSGAYMEFPYGNMVPETIQLPQPTLSFAEGGFASPDHDPNNPYHYHVNGKKVVVTPEDWEKYKDDPTFREIMASIEAEQAAYPEPEYDEVPNPAWRKAYQNLVNGVNLRGRSNYLQPLPQGYTRDTKGIPMDSQGNYYLPVETATDAPYFINQERGMMGHIVPVRYEQQQMPDRTIRQLRQPLPVDRVMNIGEERENAIQDYIKDNIRSTIRHQVISEEVPINNHFSDARFRKLPYNTKREIFEDFLGTPIQDSKFIDLPPLKRAIKVMVDKSGYSYPIYSSKYLDTPTTELYGSTEAVDSFIHNYKTLRDVIKAIGLEGANLPEYKIPEERVGLGIRNTTENYLSSDEYKKAKEELKRVIEERNLYDNPINRHTTKSIEVKTTKKPSRQEAESNAVIPLYSFAEGGSPDDPPYFGYPAGQPQGPIDYLNRYVRSKAFERRSPDAYYLNTARQNVDSFDRVYNDPAPKRIKFSPFYSNHMIQMYPGGRETPYAPYVNTMQVPYMAVLAHEYGHNIDPYFESTRDIPESWMDMYERQSSEANEHDARPQEIYADLQSLRYQLYEKNIYDIIKDGAFNEKHLEKALKQNIPNRLLQTMPKETIIEMMNTIANNSQQTGNVQDAYILPTDVGLGYV